MRRVSKRNKEKDDEMRPIPAPSTRLAREKTTVKFCRRPTITHHILTCSVASTELFPQAPRPNPTPAQPPPSPPGP
jgi:hypothetical protein